MDISQSLPAKGEEEACRKDISSEGKSPAHQSFEKALFGWSWVLKDSFNKSLPLTEER